MTSGESSPLVPLVLQQDNGNECIAFYNISI